MVRIPTFDNLDGSSLLTVPPGFDPTATDYYKSIFDADYDPVAAKVSRFWHEEIP